MLEPMVRSAVIFSDEDQHKKEEKNFRKPRQENVNLSRDEYRQIIKDAYHEGREDALKEQTKQKSPQPQKNLVASVGVEKAEKKFAKEKKQKRQQFQELTVPEDEKESVELEGKEEAIKIHARDEQENRQRFKSITARQDIELLRAKTVFPFTFFTSTIVIDTTKVTLATKQMFATEHVTTIPLKDLSDATIQTVAFLGTLMIRYMPQSNTPGMNEPINVEIPNLKREDAILAKNILKGALVAKAEEIDIAKLSPKEIAEVLHKFGQSEGVT
jgi:hypothetical protein